MSLLGEKKGQPLMESESVRCSVVYISLQPHGLYSLGKRGEPFPYPGDLPYPGIELGSPAWQADSLPSEPAGKLCL